MQVPKTNIHSDHLANDLLKIIDDSTGLGGKIEKATLMEKLVMYNVDRDHKVYNAGIEYGKQLEKGDIEPEEEQ